MRRARMARRRYRQQALNGWRFLLFVRPLSITWRLETPIPGRFMSEFVRLSA
jgi:hypothetical protein